MRAAASPARRPWERLSRGPQWTSGFRPAEGTCGAGSQQELRAVAAGTAWVTSIPSSSHRPSEVFSSILQMRKPRLGG